MRDQLEARLRTLRSEFANGQRMLSELEAREAELRETMLRIAGAIQVLEELLEQSSATQEANAERTGESDV